ncbi:MAG TPA: hypothetical protein VJ825_05605 [Gemmatimonadaceae bacterium]|nr:hypothetical protein [Gemmatimonadaceae bacterium]
MRVPFACGAPRLATVALVASALMVGCLKSTDPQPSSLQLAGTWSYTGEQTGPVRESLAGTLTISGESGTSFQGRLDLVGTNTQTGATRALTGLVSGAQSGTVVDFDASLEATPRRHVGEIKADTISGTWVGDGSGGSMASGTFRVERESR